MPTAKTKTRAAAKAARKPAAKPSAQSGQSRPAAAARTPAKAAGKSPAKTPAKTAAKTAAKGGAAKKASPSAAGKPGSPEAWFAAVAPERKDAVARLRKVIGDNLPAGFEETLAYGMLAWVVPHSLYPAGYHCDPAQPLPFLNLASQKGYIALYHMGLYADPALLAWFTSEYAKRAPAKLDMGKSCIRFKKPEHIPFDLLGELAGKVSPKQWIALYEKAFRR